MSGIPLRSQLGFQGCLYLSSRLLGIICSNAWNGTRINSGSISLLAANRGNTVRIVLGPRSQHEALGLKPSKHSFTASLVKLSRSGLRFSF